MNKNMMAATKTAAIGLIVSLCMPSIHIMSMGTADAVLDFLLKKCYTIPPNKKQEKHNIANGQIEEFKMLFREAERQKNDPEFAGSLKNDATGRENIQAVANDFHKTIVENPKLPTREQMAIGGVIIGTGIGSGLFGFGLVGSWCYSLYTMTFPTYEQCKWMVLVPATIGIVTGTLYYVATRAYVFPVEKAQRTMHKTIIKAYKEVTNDQKYCEKMCKAYGIKQDKN
jgi:hypothetical protein